MFKEGGPHFEEIGVPVESGQSLLHAPRVELGSDSEDESIEISRIFPEDAPINFAIASYFREKGPRALIDAYKRMSEDAHKSLKHAITEGDLQSVIHHIEMNDPMNLKAEKSMHAETETDQDFVRALEKSTFLLVDRARRLAEKHRARALAWQQTGVAPNIEGGLPGSADDVPSVRQKLAELPLDMRDFLERVHPQIRRRIISDNELLNTPIEQLVNDFPRLSRRIAREFIMQGRSRK